MSDSDANQLRRRNLELSILNEITQGLNGSLDLTEALQTTLAKVAALLELESGWVWLLQEQTGDSYLAATQSLPPALTGDPATMAGDCYCLRTFREGDLAGAANVNMVECSRLRGLVGDTDGLRYHASIPLYVHADGHVDGYDKQLGVLNVASRDWRRLSADDLRLLHTVGDLLSIAIERARLFNRSARLGAVEERNRLARELHDTLAQGLTAVSLQLESADVLLEAGADPNLTHKAVQKALQLTRANLDDVRRSVLDLRAAPLEGRSLGEALLVLAEQTNMTVPVSFEIVGDERPLPPRIEAGIYRVAQEALTNVVRHAQAQQVTMQLQLTPKALQLIVEDDGVGFDPEQVIKDRFGLVGMNERVRLLNGRFHLESSLSAGTRIRVFVPLS